MSRGANLAPMLDSHGIKNRVTARALLWALLIGGLLLRIALIGVPGFTNDIDAFSSWAVTLAEHPLWAFYQTSGFADYPPGYFYVLAVIGHLWEYLRGIIPSPGLLHVLVKLPAIFADLGVGALLYALARRFTDEKRSLFVAALYVLNPAVIYISAAWGQVDAIAGGLALLAAYLLLRSDDEAQPTASIIFAWLALAASLLIKPQAAVVIPFFIAFACTDAVKIRVRMLATGAGIIASFALAWLASLPFHPSLNPFAVLQWLYERYVFGSNVYPDNSVNAFNLWSITSQFWQKDKALLHFGPIPLFPQYAFGICLVVAAVALLIWRYMQVRTARAFIEGCALALLAFFLFSTRMHERYSFDGVLFVIAAFAINRRYLWSAIALSVLLGVNLAYSLAYLSVMQNHVAGVNAADLWPAARIIFSSLGVLVFFYLGNAYLVDDEPEALPAEQAAKPAKATPKNEAPRRWYEPGEGLGGLVWPLDYLVATGLGIGAFLLSFVNYWFPPEKIFDEVYFARAAEEYLKNLRIYENTHPPFTKLLITLSTMMFGGLAHGDNSTGWRFLSVVFAGIGVVVLFAFAKRVTKSTLFAAVAAAFLTFDGMHFVQSRIATPEGFVYVFSLLAVYFFYRFWIVAQTNVREHARDSWGQALLSLLGAVVGGIAIAALTAALTSAAAASHPGWQPQTLAATIVIGCYSALGLYLLFRVVVLPRFAGSDTTAISYPDGSIIMRDASGQTLYAPDGGRIDAAGKITRGLYSQSRGGQLVYTDDELSITYSKDATVTYATPAGTATYVPGEVRSDEGVAKGSHARRWLIAFAVALGLLVGSKWYGVMGFGVSFAVIIGIWLQRFFSTGRPTLWGNPRGFRLDVALVSIMFIAMTVYALVWVPDLIRQSPDPNEIHNISDVVQRQYSMFEYHDHLVATHPYASLWWTWPLDLRPVLYYAHYTKTTSAVIYTLPNPISMWFGLFCVPFVGWLAWKERRKAYALIVLDYLLQWLPWSLSPRIAWIYHFYVNVPLIALCNTIALQRLYEWMRVQNGPRIKKAAPYVVAAAVLLVAGTFIYFYPILAGLPISSEQWANRRWLGSWL